MFRALFIATNSDLTEVKGDLAEDYNVSEDGLTYTITFGRWTFHGLMAKP
ncbi:MAG: hypothetical protein ACLVHS_04580 [Blautia wexlerae]